jgi:large subunit ribosomal protein L22
MEVKAKARYIKMSPRKVRLVVDIIRGLKVNEALDQLNFIKKKAVQPVEKLINSAIANALNNHELEKDNLYIREIKVDEGPTLHRWMPRARGRATPIRKRTSHINLVLGELVVSGKTETKKKKVEAPIKLDSKPKESASTALPAQTGVPADRGKGVKIKDKKKDEKEEKISPEKQEELGKKILDPRSEGKGKHTKIEGKGSKGFVSRIFRRKSG